MPHIPKTQVVSTLSKIQSETFLIYLKTLNFHWHITGPNFIGLHELSESHYRSLLEAIDELAERILALGHRAPASFQEFTALSEVKDTVTLGTSWESMIKSLVADHETVARTIRSAIPLLQSLADEASADLLIGRLCAHEKMIWMWQAHLKK